MEQSKKDLLVQAMHRLKKERTWFPVMDGVSRGEFFMLHKISHLIRNSQEEKPGAKITDLSVAAEMSKPAVSQMLNSLEKKGLIERIMTKTDRRVVYVKLTDSGKTQLEKIAQKMDELMDQIVEELGKEDTAELARLLDKLYIILEKTQERTE